MNHQLTKQFTKMEIQEALNHMAPLKLSEPEGFNAGFYQEYWQLIRKDVCMTTLRFLNEGVFDIGIHYIYSYRSKDQNSSKSW